MTDAVINQIAVKAAVRALQRVWKQLRFGRANGLLVFLYEHDLQRMKDPDDPDIIRLLSDRALHSWLGKATARASQTMLERELRRREARPGYFVSVAALSVSLVSLLGVAMPMLPQFDHANELRCAAIQRDMLSARPRISGGAEKFQALGCHPQGNDPRIFVPPTDREMRAGKVLPFGGYPRPE